MSSKSRCNQTEDNKREEQNNNFYQSSPSLVMSLKEDNERTMSVEQKFYRLINLVSYVDAWGERFEMQHQDIDFISIIKLWEDLERTNLAKAVARWRDSKHHISVLSCFVAVNAPPALLKAILEADPNATTEKDTQHGRTPLHYGIIAEVPATIIQALLAANPNAAKVKDKYGKIPLHYRMMFGDTATLHSKPLDNNSQYGKNDNKTNIHQEHEGGGVRSDASIRAMVKVHPEFATAQ